MKPSNSIQDNSTDATRIAQSSASDSEATRIARDAHLNDLATDGTRILRREQATPLSSVIKQDASERCKIGDKIGDQYEVAAIHYGAMGVVYGCFDHETKLTRALKTIRSRYARDRQVITLFESEATVWISLEKHPYIVRAYSVETFNKLPYVITDYVRGPEGMEGDLRGWLGHPRLTLPVAVAMALQIAQGMQHAVHMRPNLVHRDLKPGNILVNGDGKAMVTDFGLVDSTQAGAGTPAYMSPEQWREDLLDTRSDIYAYGCILFEMFTAHRLFPALTEKEWETAHLESKPVVLTSLVTDMPVDIGQYVQCCLEKDVRSRPQSWDEVVMFFAEWCHRLTGKSVILDFSSLALDAAELLTASYSLFKLGRYEESLLACNRSISLEPKDPSAWFLKGHLLLFGFELHRDATIAYDKAIAIEPNEAKFWYFKDEALYFLKCYEDAIQTFDRALKVDPSFAVAWNGKGNAFKNLKRYDEAIDAFDYAIAIEPKDAITWKCKGHTLRMLKRYDEAIYAYDRAIEIDPSYEFSYRWKGELLHQLKRYGEEIQLYEQLIEIDPENAVAWGLKGDILRSLKRNDEAIQSYARALDIDPNDTDILCSKGRVLDKLKRFEEAILSYERVLTIDPLNVEIWKCKGNSLDDLERHEEALSAYDEAIAIEPDNDESWYDKGYMLNALGRYEEAIKAFDQALDIFPDNISAQNISAQNIRKSALEALKAAR